MNLEIVMDPVRKPRTGETAGDARDGAHIWTSEAMRKNYGETNPTLDDVESMEVRLKEIEAEIDGLFAESQAMNATIENGRKAPGRAELKAQLEKELTDKKMDLGKQAEALDTQKKILKEDLERAKKFLGLKEGGLPPIEYPTPTVH